MPNVQAANSMHSKGEQLQVVLVVLIVAFCTLVLTVFFVARQSAPGDGTQTIFPTAGFVPEGLPVIPLVSAPGGLEANDIVTGIQGRPVNDLIRDAFTGKWDNRALPDDTALQYMVLRNSQAQAVPVQLGPFPLVRVVQENGVSFVGLLLTFLIALYVFVRRPFLLAAQLFLVTFSLVATANVLFLIQHQASDLLRGWVFPFEVAGHAILYFVGMSAGLHFALIFPRRHPILTRHPRLIVWVYLGIWILFAVALLIRLPDAQTPAARLQLRLQSNNVSLLYFIFILLAAFSNVRHLTDESQRRQARWIGWGTLLLFVSAAIAILLAIALNLPVQTFLGIAALFSIALPASFAIAILRENLFDIDLVINRTLIYGPLTALLAVLFALSNALMDFLISGIAGEKSQISLVINTLVVVVAFNPLKERLQEIVDKRFKARPDPSKQLESLASQVRSQTTPLDIPRVLRSFLRTIVEGYQASDAQFQLNYKNVHHNSSFGNNGGGAARQIPLMFNEERLGTLELGARRNDREWSEQDIKVISGAAKILAEEILAPTLSSSPESKK